MVKYTNEILNIPNFDSNKIPVFAFKSFLQYRSKQNGWFFSREYILPFYIIKKKILFISFKLLIFTTQIISIENDLNIYDYRKKNIFLSEVIELLKNMKIDFTLQPQANAVFSIIPKKSIYCRFGTYQINLQQSKEMIFNEMHNHHKRAIKKAKKENIEIKNGEKYIDICFKIIKETYNRQGKSNPSKEYYLNLSTNLKSNVEFYVAFKDDVPQACIVLLWSIYSCYFLHGGSIKNAIRGSNNLLHWQAMLDMKQKGVKIYDFMGARIIPEKESKLEGIQRFKSRFGAELKSGYLWKIIINKRKYYFYNILLRLFCLLKGRKYQIDAIDQERKIKKAILTLDYELFLGHNTGTVIDSIIRPTEKILKILNNYNSKAIFFIDALCLMFLKENNYDDFTIISKQIQKIVKNGNDIGLHVHSQWIDAVKINKNRYSFSSFDKYRVHSLSNSKIKKIFNDSYNLLIEIINKVKPKYKIQSFRAGGWCIQPFKRIGDQLKKLNIKYDFSVLPGFYRKELPIHFYDFKNANKNKDYWAFNSDPAREDISGNFFEIPCTSLKIPYILNYINNRLLMKKYWGDGIGLSTIKLKKTNKLFYSLYNIKKIFSNILKTGSLEHISRRLLPIILSYQKNRDFITFVTHPKTLNTDAIMNIKYICKNYTILAYKEISLLCKKEFS